MKTQKIYGGFTRLRDFPLDPTTIFETHEDFLRYLLYNKTIYEGQICVVKGQGDNSGLFEIKRDLNDGKFFYKKIAYGEDVIQNANDIAILYRDLGEKHAQIEINRQNIAELTSRVETDYVTNAKLTEEISKILGDEYEELSANLNDITEISSKLVELIADLQTKIDSNTVLSKFTEYELAFTNLNNGLASLSEREDTDVANIQAHLGTLDAAIEDILPRILDDEDVLEIVDQRGLYDVLKVREFNFQTNITIDSNFLFKPGDVIKSISYTPVVAPNVNAELVPYMKHTDNTYSDEVNIITDGTFVMQQGAKDVKYHMENINYAVTKEANFAVSIPSSLSSGRGVFRIEYFRKA